MSKRLGSKQRPKIPRKQHQSAASPPEKEKFITTFGGSVVYTAQVSVFSIFVAEKTDVFMDFS